MKANFQKVKNQFKNLGHSRVILGSFCKKKGSGDLPNPLIYKVRPAGFEPATYGFVVRQNLKI